MNKFNEESLKLKIEAALPEEVLKLAKKSDAILCGGALISYITCTAVNDFDLFFKTPIHQAYFVQGFKDSKNFSVTVQTKNAITFSDQNGKVVQAIQSQFGPADLLFKNFDFYCCMGGYGFKDQKFYFHKRFLEDVNNKLLIYNLESRYPLRSLLRAKKYTEHKKFTLPAMEALKIALKIGDLKISNYTHLYQHMEAVYPDPHFYKVISHIKRQKDKDFDLSEFLDYLNSFDSRKQESNKLNIDKNLISEIPF